MSGRNGFRSESANAPLLEVPRVAVVIPCYQASLTLAAVVAKVGSEVSLIYCVDDASSDDTSDVIDRIADTDPRVHKICRRVNGGVGAAVIDGLRAAIADDATIIVKIDSDGQMDPALVPHFIEPILAGHADYVKGNRFFSLEHVSKMPALRVAGNAGLSFLSKLSTGYWDLFDPTNGYVAIHGKVARLLPLDRLHNRYFFESDILFRLATLKARIIELPIDSTYAGEESHLSEWHCALTFPLLHTRNFFKRVFYNYFLRNFSVASLSLLFGIILFAFGATFGSFSWLDSIRTGQPATAGTVMLSALPLLIGIQLLLNFLSLDVTLTPSTPIHQGLATRGIPAASINQPELDPQCSIT